MANSASIHAHNFDRVADIYDATRGFTPEAERAIGDRLAALLRAYAPEPSVLEIGVGSGRVAVPLAARGIRMTGIDISAQMLAKLRSKRRDIGVALAEASRPPFRVASFDAALFVHILHLVPDAEATLSATITCLRPGALVLSCHHSYETGPAGKAADRLREIIEEVTSRPARAHGRHYRTTRVFDDFLQARGANFERFDAAGWVERSTARALVADVAAQTHSNTWSIPDAAMPEILRRFAPEAESIYGGLDTIAETPIRFEVTVAHLPA